MFIKADPLQTQKVAILGSGITSIMTALELLKKGCMVTIYSRKFPKFNENNPRNKISSQRSGHVWFPGYYDNEDPLKHELLAKLSFDYFKDCINSSRYQSISWCNFYSKGSKNEEMQEVVSEFISTEFKDILLNFGN